MTGVNPTILNGWPVVAILPKEDGRLVVLVHREDQYSPWVTALWGPSCGDSWDQGSYFSDRGMAMRNMIERAEIPQEPDDGDSDEYPEDRDGEADMEFAHPGGNSALRAASSSNPRNLPCPSCESPNRLTSKDVTLGYQCDSCADAAENGWGY